MKRALVLLLCAGLAAADEPPPPAAPPDEKATVEEARVYFDAGRQAYERGDYGTAIRSFEHAFEKVPRPEIAFSLAQAYRKQFIVDGDTAKLRRAVELYRRYLDEVSEGGRREDAVQNLGELQPQLQRLDALQAAAAVPAPPPPPPTQLMVMSPVGGAFVAIDDSPLTAAPITRDVAPGRHRVHAEAPGFVSAELDGLAVEGRLVVIEAALRERPAFLTVDVDPGADVTLDGRPIDAAIPIATPAGRHVVTVAERGHVPWVREVALQRGTTSLVHADLQQTGQRKLATGVFIVSGALVAGGVATTVLALVAQNQAQGLLDKRAASGWSAGDLSDYNSDRSRRDTFVMGSAVLYGAAAVAAVTGLLLYIADTPAPARVGPEVIPLVGQGGGGLAVLATF